MSEKIFNGDVFRRVLSSLMIRSKGTLILRRRGRFYKVICTRHVKDNWWIFECKDIDKKKDVTFNFQILGMLEVLDKASTMKDPKDILLIDLDQQGKWMMWTLDELKNVLDTKKRKRNRDRLKRKAQTRTHKPRLHKDFCRCAQPKQ